MLSSHTVRDWTLPNAVALACTPDSATLPASKHVSLPATLYVRPVAADRARSMHRTWSATATSPLGIRPTSPGRSSAALVPATPTTVPVVPPLPMMVVMIPVDSDARRTLRLPYSVQYANEASAAAPCGSLIVAKAAEPPSPLNEFVPLPATLRTLQMATGDGDAV